jgi:hypothetical protein
LLVHGAGDCENGWLGRHNIKLRRLHHSGASYDVAGRFARPGVFHGGEVSHWLGRSRHRVHTLLAIHELTLLVAVHFSVRGMDGRWDLILEVLGEVGNLGGGRWWWHVVVDGGQLSIYGPIPAIVVVAGSYYTAGGGRLRAVETSRITVDLIKGWG